MARKAPWILSVVVSAAALLGGTATLAQDASTPLDAPEQFRADFSRFAEVFARAASRTGDSARATRILQARQLMLAVPAEDLERMSNVAPLPDLKPLIEASTRLDQQLARAQRARTEEMSVAPPESAAFPNRPAIISECNAIVHDSSTTYALKLVQQAADVVLAAAGRICDEVIVILGAGGNGALVCLPFEIALTAAKIPFELADFCGGEEDSSFLEGNYDRLAHLHGDLEAEANSIRTNDNTNRDTIISNDNNNTVAIVSNDNVNAANIIANANSNTLSIITNDNTNRDTIVNNDNANRDLLAAEIQAAKGEIIADIRGLACDLIRLVNTPEGRRSSDILACASEPGYPYDFPEPRLPRGVASAEATAAAAARPSVPVSLLAGRAFLDVQLLDGRLAPALYLPGEQGGMLEQVRALVWQAVDAHGSLGISSAANARAAAARGDSLLAGKQYVAAYRQYSRAYRSLVPSR